MPLEERPRHYFNNYTWALPLHLRRKGLAHIGDNERLRVVLDRYTKGEQCHCARHSSITTPLTTHPPSHPSQASRSSLASLAAASP